MATQKDSRRLRIKHSIRAKISGIAEKPRLSVFRSNTGIYAQIIDDVKGHTLAAASSKELGLANGNVDNAKQVGAKIQHSNSNIFKFRKNVEINIKTN